MCSLMLPYLIQNNKKSVTVSGNFPKLFPRNYESVTFGQFWEGGGKDTDGPIGNGNIYLVDISAPKKNI